MYKHILIPTDGSDLSRKAIEHGVALARSIGASVVGITVSPTFHTFAVDPVIVTETPEQYRQNCEALAERDLGVVRDVARNAGLPTRASTSSMIIPTGQSSRPPGTSSAI